MIVFGNERKGDKAKLKVKHHLSVIDAEAGTISVDDLDALASDDDVSYIALDAPVAATAAGAPVSYPSLATLYPTIDGAQTAWSLGYNGAGVGVAVIDSGGTAAADFGPRLTQVLLQGQTTSVDANGHENIFDRKYQDVLGYKGQLASIRAGVRFRLGGE